MKGEQNKGEMCKKQKSKEKQKYKKIQRRENYFFEKTKKTKKIICVKNTFSFKNKG